MYEVDDREKSRKRLEQVYRSERRSFLRQIEASGVVLSEAEDILQDAFARALNRLDALLHVQNLSAWMSTTIRNRLVDLWRRGRTRRAAGLVELSEELFEAVALDLGLDPLDEFVRDELVDDLVEAIDALPEKDREVILAQFFEGTTFRELSERTGVPIETLSARKRAAIRKLAEMLREWIAE